MYLIDNPVLQRELLVNLRSPRAFVLLFAYVALLGVVVCVAWPAADQLSLDLTVNPEASRRLVNMFFLGQYILMVLMTPSFAAGAITGEKEQKTYEMLLASPIRPGAIVLGKLLAAMCHLAVLVFASLPIVMLCLPLGGVSLYEVLATYLAMAVSVVMFGMVCLLTSSYFSRTIASLVVSYLAILPLALFGVLVYSATALSATFRLTLLAGVVPVVCVCACAVMMRWISVRLLTPPDIGSQADGVVDLENEQRGAVGMVIRAEQFPDWLFVPQKRSDLMKQGANPVYDKEIRAEIFGSGTLMLRLVVQISMFLALPLMAVFLYIAPPLAPWYVSYVLLFNLLVGPAFAAGCMTGERERQTLELLLTTTLSARQIVCGKLFSSLRVSCILTSFIVWPLLLAWLLPPWTFWDSTPTMVAYVLIIFVTAITTTMIATFCSVLFQKTSISLITTYIVLIVLFAVPLAVRMFAELYFPGVVGLAGAFEFTSPFAATFSLPLELGPSGHDAWLPITVNVFVVFYLVVNTLLLHMMLWLFRRRWRVV